MPLKKYFSAVLLGFVALTAANAQQQKPTVGIAPWLDNKKAAVSLTFDDAINGQFTFALPLLNKYGFRSTFFIIATFVQPQLHGWQPVIDAANAGHEIANHTLSHPHLHAQTADSIAYQITACSKLITQYMPAQKSLTMAYPYGDGGNETDSERVVRAVTAKYSIAARAVRNNRLPYNAYGFAKSEDDYYKVNSDMIADSASMASFAAHVDETIQAGGWYVPTYHGIENGWIIVPVAVFARHLQELDNRKADLWIAPFADVVKYDRERGSATIKITTENKHALKLAITDTLANQTIYNQPLTVNITPVGYAINSITQAGNTLPFTANGNMVTFNAVPGAGEVTITKN